MDLLLPVAAIAVSCSVSGYQAERRRLSFRFAITATLILD